MGKSLTFVAGLYVLALGQPLAGNIEPPSQVMDDSTAISPEVSRIIDSLRTQFEQIEDYQVRLTVSIKMPGLRMPRKRMTFSFKQPDKVHLKSRGFAMIPKNGLLLSPDSLFARISSPNLVQTSGTDGCACLIIEGETRLMDDLQPHMAITIDTTRWVVTNISTWLGDEELLKLETTYMEVVPGIYMPAETKLQFEISEEFMRINPRALNTARDSDQEATIKFPGFKAGKKDKLPRSGEAIIQYSRYKVNQGLEDTLFDEEE